MAMDNPIVWRHLAIDEKKLRLSPRGGSMYLAIEPRFERIATEHTVWHCPKSYRVTIPLPAGTSGVERRGQQVYVGMLPYSVWAYVPYEKYYEQTQFDFAGEGRDVVQEYGPFYHWDVPYVEKVHYSRAEVDWKDPNGTVHHLVWEDSTSITERRIRTLYREWREDAFVYYYYEPSQVPPTPVYGGGASPEPTKGTVPGKPIYVPVDDEDDFPKPGYFG